jgi:hypothetical protein
MNGLDVVPGTHLIMVDQPEAFAQCVQDKGAALVLVESLPELTAGSVLVMLW